METLVKLMPLTSNLWQYVAMDLAIALLLLLVLRFIQGKVASVSVTEEIGERDNFAYGIGMAGGLLSLCIVLSAVVGRHVGQSLSDAAINMVMFGVVGIALVRFGRLVHDKLVLNRIVVIDMLAEKNNSVALVDAASAIASAIVIRSMILWVEGTDSNAIIAIVSGFLVVLTILVLLTRLYEWRYASCNQNESFQQALTRGQLAVALDHAGNILGTALVVTIAADLIAYAPDTYVSNITGWLFVSILLCMCLKVLVETGKRLLLFGVSINAEIDQQENVGVACIGLVLNLGIAILASGFFAR